MFSKTVLIDEPFIGNIKNNTVENKAVKIGFAGTVTHKRFIDDFLRDVLKNIKNKYKEKVEFEFFGVKPQFINEIHGNFIPYSDSYEEYCRIMNERNWDVGLAPLEQSEFASCKYFNKYIEYSSYGIAGIYSAVEPYIFAIKNGVNGLLAENTVESWINAIESFINDRVLLKMIANNAQSELSERFTVQNIAQLIYDEEIFNNKSEHANIRHKRRSFVLSKIKLYGKMYGRMTIIMIIRKAIGKIKKP